MPWTFIDIGHLDAMIANTRWANPNGNNSKKRSRHVNKMEDIRVVKKALNGNNKTKLKILVLTIDAVETSPWLLQALHHHTTHI